MKTYQALARTFQAYLNCIESKNSEWQNIHEETITKIMDCSPSGSGIDCGTRFSFEESTPEKLVLTLSYHHMNNGGYYDGWTKHTVIVTPSLQFGCNIKITGKNKNEIKEYLQEVYNSWITEDIDINSL